MTYDDRKVFDIVKRGTKRVFLVPLPDGSCRWFVQGEKGRKGHTRSRDEALVAIRNVR